MFPQPNLMEASSSQCAILFSESGSPSFTSPIKYSADNRRGAVLVTRVEGS